jgi:protein phosphatase
MIDDDLIQNVLEQESSPQRAAERLCEEAVHAGGNDNVTTVVVDFPDPELNSRSERATGSFATAPVPPVRRTDTDPVSAGASTGRVQTMSAPRPPSTGSSPIRSSSTSGPQQTRGKKHLLAWLAVAVVVLGAAAFLARMSIKGSWYVGVDRGRVAVFNGIPGSLAGFDLGELSSRTDLRSDVLPELYQGRLEEGIKANSRTDARAIVADLEKLAPPPALEPQPPAGEESPAPADPAGPPPA